MEALRSLLLHICVARTLKNLMAIEMRSMMKMNNFPTETPFKRLFVKFWNTLLLDDSIVNPKSKIYFWTQDIKREIEARCVCFSSLLFPLLFLLSGISGSHSSLFSLFVGCFFFSLTFSLTLLFLSVPPLTCVDSRSVYRRRNPRTNGISTTRWT
jgi:hypothetical protein